MLKLTPALLIVMSCIKSVSSIASEFLQNRAQHDRTAKRWTELYARPAPLHIHGGTSEKSLPSSSSQKSNTSSLNGVMASHCRNSRPVDSPPSAPPISNSHAPIEISDDSDEGTNLHLQRKRKREGHIPREQEGKSRMGRKGTRSGSVPKRRRGEFGLAVRDTDVITIDD